MSRCLMPLSGRSRMTSDGGRSIWTYALMMKERADRAGIRPDTCLREAIASRHVRDLRLRERNYYPRSTNDTSSCRALGLPPFYFLFLCAIRQAWIRDAWSATRCPSRKNPWRGRRIMATRIVLTIIRAAARRFGQVHFALDIMHTTRVGSRRNARIILKNRARRMAARSSDTMTSEPRTGFPQV